jgi:hypothetical protein
MNPGNNPQFRSFNTIVQNAESIGNRQGFCSERQPDWSLKPLGHNYLNKLL